MFNKVLEYAGGHRRTTYAAVAVLLAAVACSVLPFFCLFRIIRPLLLGQPLSWGETAGWAAAIAVCLSLHAVLYVQETFVRLLSMYISLHPSQDRHF